MIATKVYAEFAGRGNGWTDVSLDLAPAPIQADYGIQGDGPNDRVARTGTLRFALLNNPANSAGLTGYYSPDHSNKRSGFALGIGIRVVFVVAGRQLVKFVGTLEDINPEGGKSRNFTICTAVDYMEDLATRPLGHLELRTDVRADELFQDVIAAMSVQPPAIEIAGQGQELYAFAFDTSKQKSGGLAELQRIAQSDGGYIYPKGGEIVDPVAILTSEDLGSGEALVTTDEPHLLTDGDSVTVSGHSDSALNGSQTVQVTGPDTFTVEIEITGGTGGTVTRQAAIGGAIVFEARTTRTRKSTNVLTFTDQQYHGIQTERGRKSLINAFRVTAHPRLLGDSDEEILYASSQVIVIAANSSRRFVIQYQDPSNPSSKVGGMDMQPPEPHVDYAVNSSPDGSGADLTDFLQIEVNFGAGGANFTLSNPTTQSMSVLVPFQFRGRPIFDFQNVELEQRDEDSIARHGERVESVDLAYNGDDAFADEYAQYLLSLWKNPSTRVPRVSETVGRDDVRALAVLLREPGDRIAVQETVTGINTGFFIQGVSLEAKPGSLVTVSLSLIRADQSQYWFLNQPGASELGVTTRLGFGLTLGHTDLAHQDGHGDSEHSDVEHGDSHGDSHGDEAHTDTDGHGDVSHDDDHADEAHQDVSHVDTHSDSAHQDVAHSDSHSDSAHSDSHDDFHGDHGDGQDEEHTHFDSHTDSAHQDSHSDSSHVDSEHVDGHDDVQHVDDNHEDIHFDEPHVDSDGHADVEHNDGHTDEEHDDTLHDDAGHTDEHSDIPHGDQA